MDSPDRSRRRALLRLQHDEPSPLGLTTRAPGEVPEPRQLSLSVPESIRALGEPLDPFFSACGGLPLSLSVRQRDAAETIVFRQPFVLVGRSPENDVVVNDERSAFRHFYLQLVGSRWAVVDLRRFSSATESTRTSGWFHVGAELRLGACSIARVDSGANWPREPIATDSELNATRFELEFVNGRSRSRQRKAIRIESPMMLIGQAQRCGLRLSDESVSKVHASLVLTPRGLWIVDLLGRGGVIVDDQPAYWKHLHEGSTLQIGRYQFRVRARKPARRKARPAADRPRQKKSPPATPPSVVGNGLSEGGVLALMQHLMQMQTQFFEHSRLQTQLITEMLSHLGRAQQASVREDLARIEEIDRSLQEIKAQLARDPEPLFGGETIIPGAPDVDAVSDVDAPAEATQPQDGTTKLLTCDEQLRTGDSSVDPAAESIGQLPENELAADQPCESGLPAESIPPKPQAGPMETAAAHALLSQRMANLASERNSRWRRVVGALFGNRSQEDD